MNQNYSLIDYITIVSFVLQLSNNEELHKQSTNDEIQQNLHEDVMRLLEDNRKLFKIVIEQNNEILKLLKKES